MQIAVGGCLAQKDRGEITKKAPWVDVVFGTHNIGSLPVLLERARVQEEAQVEILESLEVFPSTLPTKRESAYAAWVSISVGCNNTCTFCIVPSLRGKEKDRRPGEILAEIEALVAEGVSEVTLLGQNVNTYGVEFGDRLAFGKLLRACGEIEGLERVRFTSPHPAAFTDDVIEAMAETPQRHAAAAHAAPVRVGQGAQGHAPVLPPGAKFLGIIDRVRAAMPDAAITTDIIVGFPGETEEDFLETMRVVEQARFSGAFTFQYSKRPGTPAAVLEDQVPREVVQDRYERLVALVNDIAWEENKKIVGGTVELLVAEGEGRKDAATQRLTGRARDNRLVHFTAVDDDGRPVDVRPGDMVEVEVTYAAPHHLVSDAPVRSVRRTRAGDAWEARNAAPEQSSGVLLGPADGRRARAAPRDRRRLLALAAPITKGCRQTVSSHGDLAVGRNSLPRGDQRIAASEAVGDDRRQGAVAQALDHLAAHAVRRGSAGRRGRTIAGRRTCRLDDPGLAGPGRRRGGSSRPARRSGHRCRPVRCIAHRGVSWRSLDA